MIDRRTAPRLLKCALLVLAVGLVWTINSNLASLAENVWSFLAEEISLTGPVTPHAVRRGTHLALLCLEALAFFLFWKGSGSGRKHLLLHDDSPEGSERFAQELVRRMRSNPHIREAGIVPDGPEDAQRIAACMALLRARANTEIELNAKRIFLATALSQNGRLDALIVFCSLCRLVWRISTVYAQRPHPREIVSLYWAVISSTFLALSMEELDIPTEIGAGLGRAFHAIAPAGFTASIPFAGKALQIFTSSAIDGAINCYLALRAGIITRNAYDYAFAVDQRPSRAAVYQEAGTLLLAMSASLMDGLAGKLAGTLAGAMENARNTTVQAGKDLFQGIGRMGASVGRAATEAGSGDTGSLKDGPKLVGVFTGAVRKARNTAVQAGKDACRGIGRMGVCAGKAAADAGTAAKGAAQRTAGSIGRGLGARVRRAGQRRQS